MCPLPLPPLLRLRLPPAAAPQAAQLVLVRPPRLPLHQQVSLLLAQQVPLLLAQQVPLLPVLHQACPLPAVLALLVVLVHQPGGLGHVVPAQLQLPPHQQLEGLLVQRCACAPAALVWGLLLLWLLLL